MLNISSISLAGSRTSPFILALSVLALQWPRETTAFPTMPLSSLFANAVLRAQHLHLLASNTFKEFDIELLRFSLTLIQSWLSPVRFLSRVFTNSQALGTSDRVFENLQDLEEGIQALMRLDDGNAWGFQLLRRTYDKFDVNLQNKGSLLKNYRLLSCFKKDLHKVETYLKVMKCRRFGEINCTF
uniref:Growth hormone n=1 Tax=Salvator merianae TaxID=96440 RepID=A0A8D0BLM6_SALMN